MATLLSTCQRKNRPEARNRNKSNKELRKWETELEMRGERNESERSEKAEETSFLTSDAMRKGGGGGGGDNTANVWSLSITTKRGAVKKQMLK
jgi:hypothetical protein